MQISLTNPELQRFIDEKVKAGEFSSPGEVIEAGLARMMLDADFDELDQRDIEVIRKSLHEFTRGEARDWKQCSVELRDKYLPK
jgi:Arc/MetJ-type ribon-helix-helix transcriptional regulator